MRYVSTRGSAPALGFDEVLLTGLARDGGLYVPESWPQLTAEQLRSFATRPYDAVAVEVMWPYVDGAIDRGAFESMVFDAYATFTHPDVCPVRSLGGGVHLPAQIAVGDLQIRLGRDDRDLVVGDLREQVEQGHRPWARNTHVTSLFLCTTPDPERQAGVPAVYRRCCSKT